MASSLHFRIDGVDLGASSVRLDATSDGPSFQFAEAIDYGRMAMGAVTIDDPGGIYDFTGLKSFQCDEDDTTPSRLYSGFIGPRTLKRGEKQRTGASRIHQINLLDLNWNLMRRSVRTEAAKRPAETDVVRIAWIVSVLEGFGLVWDEGLVNTTDNVRNLGETDYRHQYPLDIIGEFAGRCGKTFGVYYDVTSGHPALFYDVPTATGYDSTLRISNVASDVDSSTTFAPLKDAELNRVPDDTYSGIDYGYLSNWIYAHDPVVAADFAERDLIFQTSAVGRLATAQSQVAAMLAQRSGEQDTITVVIVLPSNKINLLRAGMRVECKFSHLPGYESFTFLRVLERNIFQRDDQQYIVSLKLSLETKVGPGSTSPGVPYTCSPVEVTQAAGAVDDVTFSTAPTDGNTLVYFAAKRSSAFTEPNGAGGYTIGPDGEQTSGSGNGDRVAIMYKTASSDGATLVIPNNEQGGGWVELPGTWTLDQHAEATGSGTSPTATITAGVRSCVVFVCGIGSGGVWDASAGSVTWTTPAGWTRLDVDNPSGAVGSGHPNIWAGYILTDAGGSYSGAPTCSSSGQWMAQIASFTAGPCPEPFPGQHVGPTDGGATGDVDGSNTDFTTSHLFQDGSLHVLHDGIDQSAHVTTSDGSAGTFTLDYAPDGGSTIRTYYLGR